MVSDRRCGQPHPWGGISFGEGLAPAQLDLEQAAPVMFVLGRVIPGVQLASSN